MPPDPRLFDDDKFRGLTRDEQRAVLSGMDEKYRGLPEPMQHQILEQLVHPVTMNERIGRVVNPIAQQIPIVAGQVGEAVTRAGQAAGLTTPIPPRIPGVTTQEDIDRASAGLKGNPAQNIAAGPQRSAAATTGMLGNVARAGAWVARAPEELAKTIGIPELGEPFGAVRRGLEAAGRRFEEGAQGHEAIAAARSAAGLEGAPGVFLETLSALPFEVQRMMLTRQASQLHRIPGLAQSLQARHHIDTALTFMLDTVARGGDVQDTLMAGGTGVVMGGLGQYSRAAQMGGFGALGTGMRLAEGAPLAEAIAGGAADAFSVYAFNPKPKHLTRVVPRYDPTDPGVAPTVTESPTGGARGRTPEVPDVTQPQPAPPAEPRAPVEPPVPAPGEPTPPPPTPGEPTTLPPAAPIPPGSPARSVTSIALPGGETLPARYEFREASDLITSHDTWTFSPRADYGGLVNERPYHRDQAEQMGVLNIAKNWDSRFIYNDTPTAIDGPPIILPDNRVVGGNRRTMGTARQGVETLREAAAANASKFGLDPAAAREMERPVIVRVLENAPESVEQANILIRRLNEDFKHVVSPGDRGIANARSLSRETLESLHTAISNIAETKDTGIRSVLQNNRNLVTALERDGIIRTENRSEYVSTDGVLTTEGLKMVEDALLGRVISDPDVLSAAPDSFRNVTLRSVGQILAADNAAPELGLRNMVEDAFRHESRRRSKNLTMEQYANQGDLLGGNIADVTVAMMKLLSHGKPTEVNRRFRRFAQELDEAQSGQMRIGEEPMTMGKAFKNLLGIDPPHVPAETPAGQALLRRDAPGVGPHVDPQQRAAGPPGRNYRRNQMADIMPPDAELPKEIRGREKFLVNVAKRLKLPIQQGRLRLIGHRFKRNVLGFFMPRNSLTRIRTWGDFQTGIHEIFHALADQYKPFRDIYDAPGLSQKLARQEAEIAAGKRQALDPDAQVLREMLDVSYDSTMPWEGGAESGRLWATRKDYFQQVAPNAYRALEAVISGAPKEVRDALYDFQRDAHAFHAQGALATGMSKIVGEHFGGEPPRPTAGEVMPYRGRAGPRGWLSRKAGEFREVFFDKHHWSGQAERDLTGRIQKDGGYQTLRRLTGSSDIVSGLVEFGVPKFGGRANSLTFQGKSLMQIFEPVARTTSEAIDALLYTVGRRARELTNRDLEVPFDQNEVQSFINRGLRPDRRERFEQFHRDLIEYQDQALQFAVDAGLISRADYARIKEANQEYSIAFFRDMADTISRSSGGRAEMERGGNPLKNMHGSTRSLKNPLEMLITGPERIIRAALMNRAKLEHLRQLEQAPGGGKYVQRISPEDERVRLGIEQLRQGLKAQYKQLGLKLHEREIDSVLGRLEAAGEKGVNFMQWESKFPGGPGVERVFENGEPIYYEVFDTGLFRSLQAVVEPEPYLRLMNAVRTGEQGAITAHIGFMLANMVRDPQAAIIASRNARAMMRRAPAAFLDALFRGPMTQEYIANGGGGGILKNRGDWRLHDFVRHSQRVNGDLARLMKAELVWAPRDLARMWGRFQQAGELYLRIAEMQGQKAHGETPSAATFFGKNLTVDFSKRGSGNIGLLFGMKGKSEELRALFQTSKFLTAGLAGLDTDYQNIRYNDYDRRAATITKWVAYTAAISAIDAMMRHNNPGGEEAQEDYNKLPDYALDNQIVLDLPANDTDAGFVRFTIPLAYELSLPSAMFKRWIRMMENSDKPQDRMDASDVVNLVMSNHRLNAPIFFEEYSQQMANRDWAGRPLVPPDLERKPPGLQYDENSPALLRELGRFAERTAGLGRPDRDNPYMPNFIESPKRAEHILNTWISAWGADALLAAEKLFMDEENRRASRGVEDIPGIKRLMDEPGRLDESEQFYYEHTKDMESARQTVRHFEAEENESRLEELKQIPYVPPFAQKYIDKINEAIRVIEDDPKLTRDQKAEETKKLKLERRQIMGEYLEEAERVRKAMQK